MQPRLKSSQKWTELPKEYVDQIRTAFMENFGTQIGEGKLLIEGRIYPQEILLRVGYLEAGRLAQTNFEVSMDYKPEEAVERIHNCIDAAASMMMEYFEEDGEVDFPYVWKPFPFQKKTIYLQFSTENSELEAEADRLLGSSVDDLVHEETEDEDALSRAEIDEELSGGQEMAKDVFGEEHGASEDGATDEDIEEEDEDDDGQPRMFKGKGKRRLH
ncbi:MAG: hypothetical protein KF789_05995 [Bdellovibrionaceae bacterium]|nr:hypothetical protein [Pseudobdellovibrionaceae bacterium]